MTGNASCLCYEHVGNHCCNISIDLADESLDSGDTGVGGSSRSFSRSYEAGAMLEPDMRGYDESMRMADICEDGCPLAPTPALEYMPSLLSGYGELSPVE